MNQDIFYFLNNFALNSESLDTIFIFLADWLIWWVIFYVVVLFFLKKITLKLITKILIATLLAWLISKIIKYFYFSPRPFVLLDDVKMLFNHGLNDSFPSGHATFTFALAMAVSLFKSYKIGILLFISAILISLSRVIVGIHWPLDILAGSILGIVIPLIFWFLQKKRSESTKSIRSKNTGSK